MVPATGFISMILVIAAVLFATRGTLTSILIGVGLFFLALSLQTGIRLSKTRMRFVVSPHGVLWNHPQKGSGGLLWADIGALSIREDGMGGELALILTPRERDAGPSLIALASEMSPSPRKSRQVMLDYLTVLLRHLPPETVIDRPTRAWLKRNGLGGELRADDKMDRS